MKTIIIVSKCMKIERLKGPHDRHHFHFKGVCAGELLRKVELLGRKDMALLKGEEYLMYVELESFKDGVLKGTILRARLLDECWDRS